MEEKRLERVVFGLAFGIILIHPILSFWRPTVWWGVDELAYYPGWVSVVACAVAILLILPPVSGFLFTSKILQGASLPVARAPRALLYVLGLGAACVLFNVFETKTHLLGDGALWIRELTNPLGRLEGEPLTIVLARLLYRSLGGIDEATAEWTYRSISITAGVLFVITALLASRSMSRNAGENVTAVAFVLTLGTIQIFFGYAEHYAPVTLFILLFMWAGRSAADGKVRLVIPAAILGTACALHFLAFVLVPALLVLVYAHFRKGDRIPTLLLQISAFPLVFIGLLLAAGYELSFEWGRLGGIAKTVPLWTGDAFLRPHPLISLQHVLDVINSWLLTSPMGLLLCLCVVVARKDRIDWRDAKVWFLASATVSFLAFTCVLNPEIGAFRDWDLFSVGGVPLALLSAYLLSRGLSPGSHHRIAWTVSVVSIFHLALWVGVNANEARALERFETILRDKNRLSVHALGSSYDELRAYYERSGAPEKAASAARGSYEAHPLHPRYLANTLRLMETSSPGEVGEFLEQATEIAPDFSKLQIELARFHRRSGRRDEALEAATRAIRLDSLDAEGHAEMGEILRSIGQYDQAVWSLKRAIYYGSTDEHVYFALGMSHAKMGELEQALGAFRSAVSLNAASDETWTNLGVAAFRLGLIEASEDAFRRAIILDPKSTKARSGLAVIYQRRGDSDRALRLFREISDTEPDDVQAHLNLASAAYERGDLQLSVVACRRVLAVDPRHQKALLNLCSLHLAMGNQTEADGCIRRYTELFGTSQFSSP